MRGKKFKYFQKGLNLTKFMKRKIKAHKKNARGLS